MGDLTIDTGSVNDGDSFFMRHVSTIICVTEFDCLQNTYLAAITSSRSRSCISVPPRYSNHRVAAMSPSFSMNNLPSPSYTAVVILPILFIAYQTIRCSYSFIKSTRRAKIRHTIHYRTMDGLRPEVPRHRVHMVSHSLATSLIPHPTMAVHDALGLVVAVSTNTI